MSPWMNARFKFAGFTRPKLKLFDWLQPTSSLTRFWKAVCRDLHLSLASVSEDVTGKQISKYSIMKIFIENTISGLSEFQKSQLSPSEQLIPP